MATTTQTPTCKWRGNSGTAYTYYIYKLPTRSWKAEPGNYIFAKVVDGKWRAIYAGETSDLSSRFTGHHQQACIDRNGATHIHAHINRGGDQARRDEERDVRLRYSPPCNQQ